MISCYNQKKELHQKKEEIYILNNNNNNNEHKCDIILLKIKCIPPTAYEPPL